MSQQTISVAVHLAGNDYRFPVVEADVVYLWPVRERVDVVQYPTPWPWWGWW